MILLTFIIKVIQNEFMKSSFLPKYEQKIVKISALTTQGREPPIDPHESSEPKNDRTIFGQNLAILIIVHREREK